MCVWYLGKRDLLIDCYAKPNGNSCNASLAPSLRGSPQGLTKQSIPHLPSLRGFAKSRSNPKNAESTKMRQDSIKSTKIDLQVWVSYGRNAHHALTSSSLADDSPTPSLQGQQLAEVICSLSSLRGFAKAEAIHKENPLIETTKSQGYFVKSAKDSSDFIDCLEVKASFNDSNGTIPREFTHSCNDEIGANHHAKSQIRNDTSLTPSLRGSPQGLTKQSINATRIESAESIKDSNIIDLQVWVSYGRNAHHEALTSFNDGNGTPLCDSIDYYAKPKSNFRNKKYRAVATKQERFTTQTTALSLLR